MQTSINTYSVNQYLRICRTCSIEQNVTLCLSDGTRCCPCNFYMLSFALLQRSRRPAKKSSFSKCKHYEVTLTTMPLEEKADFNVVTKLLKFLNSKQFQPTDGWTACLEHATTNAHVHMSVHTTRYMPIADILKLNKARVSVTRLKTPMELTKWDSYVKKMEDDKVYFENKVQIQAWLEQYGTKTIDTLDFD